MGKSIGQLTAAGAVAAGPAVGSAAGTGISAEPKSPRPSGAPAAGAAVGAAVGVEPPQLANIRVANRVRIVGASARHGCGDMLDLLLRCGEFAVYDQDGAARGFVPPQIGHLALPLRPWPWYNSALF